MKNPNVAKKQSTTLRELYKTGVMVPPELSGSRFKRGYYQSKNGKVFHYDSGWELERMKYLDSFMTIQWEKNQSEIRISYHDGNKDRTYFPDFIIRRKGRNMLLAIEEVGAWTDTKTLKIKAAHEYFKSKGINYAVIEKREGLQSKTW